MSMHGLQRYEYLNTSKEHNTRLDVSNIRYFKIRKDAAERGKDTEEDDAIHSAIDEHETEIMNIYDAAKLVLESFGWHEGMRPMELFATIMRLALSTVIAHL